MAENALAGSAITPNPLNKRRYLSIMQFEPLINIFALLNLIIFLKNKIIFSFMNTLFDNIHLLSDVVAKKKTGNIVLKYPNGVKNVLRIFQGDFLVYDNHLREEANHIFVHLDEYTIAFEERNINRDFYLSYNIVVPLWSFAHNNSEKYKDFFMENILMNNILVPTLKKLYFLVGNLSKFFLDASLINSFFSKGDKTWSDFISLYKHKNIQYLEHLFFCLFVSGYLKILTYNFPLEEKTKTLVENEATSSEKYIAKSALEKLISKLQAKS